MSFPVLAGSRMTTMVSLSAKSRIRTARKNQVRTKHGCSVCGDFSQKGTIPRGVLTIFFR